MEPNARFRRNVRIFYAWLGSLLVLGATPVIAVRLIDHGSLPARVMAVTLGVLWMLPWMWVVVSIVRRGDEFMQRLHLVACAGALGGTFILIATLAVLVRADFIDPPDLMLVLFGCLLVWLIALMAAKRHFEGSR